jgi:hypothetical protein
MGDHSGDTRPGDAVGVTGRRDFLRRAAVAGTSAFTVPMIVTVDPADAQTLTSPPPEPPGPSTRPERPGSSSGPPTRAEGTLAAGRRVSGRTELPSTGADIERLVAAGLAATAGGAALVLWSADAKSGSAPSRSGDPEPEA